ncbi:uncharacterized protein ARMOST_03432 [Armillaria ostoyae]|uniref:Uncharacterized protein n=1 Tax=Armillaria ostoyae TaxID=47428 RepID=A0A284QUG1_ARMOS|nr:uncharacterized protein ARMOST_03432 [Armillaria ostoyae]
MDQVDHEDYSNDKISTLHSHPVQSNTMMDFDDPIELNEDIATPIPAGFSGINNTDNFNDDNDFCDPGCLDDLDADEPEPDESPIHRTESQASDPSQPGQTSDRWASGNSEMCTAPEPTWSAINDVRIAQKFIWELQNVTANDCDIDFIDNLRNLPTEQLSIDDPYHCLSLDIFLSIHNVSEHAYTSVCNSIWHCFPDIELLSFYQVK